MPEPEAKRYQVLIDMISFGGRPIYQGQYVPDGTDPKIVESLLKDGVIGPAENEAKPEPAKKPEAEKKVETAVKPPANPGR